ncbi:tannase/feruloyl esterase family alpha/beta hydrolase [Amycolatopsis tucumanensis]|uniref:Tannase/feruloyl esterase family alpha/beta hydrolase n=1 Tax=Amycolatopsis tucumanensis TaxID=401106 RepID=A0ABP7J9Z3_9PSEU|nr:tannase/feruloyl esterase family alpha/beta hydrolase [Amycolatopsis tucumanensis]MCF6421805.1 tannase/feruloyl esterase family alpha/beta hydrolase [Amycolatopsis tucumanensis]
MPEKRRARRLTGLLAAAMPLAALIPLAASASTQLAPAQAATPACTAVPVTAPEGAKIESVQAEHHDGGTVSFPATPLAPAAEITGVPAYCQITVTVTHTGSDHVKIAVALPETGWTGRLQGVGGSAYAAGNFGPPLVQAVKDGYAGVTTDAGVRSELDTSWVVTADGTVDQALLTDFASRSVHESALIGKDVVREHYQRGVSYAYWNGCSTGGRQGYEEAQKYANDFDGILANAPAVNWTQFAVATLWPQTVMNNDHHFVSNCVLGAFQQAAIQACDPRDGVTNGIIDRPDECSYDPRSLVGKKVLCDGQEVTVTTADADVMRKIWNGPTDERGRSLWSGLPKGADYTWLAGTAPGPGGQLTAPGFPVAVQWVQAFLEKQPGFDTSKLTYAQYRNLFRQSVREYDRVIGTSDPDLSDFRRSGGKLITFVGTADQLIPPGGTLAYRSQVEQRMGGAEKVNDFYRLFLAPGVQHCGGGAGAQPVNALGALVDWVEHGKAPATLAATTLDGSASRDLCPLPQVSRYQGYGDPALASSYRCTRF